MRHEITWRVYLYIIVLMILCIANVIKVITETVKKNLKSKREYKKKNAHNTYIGAENYTCTPQRKSVDKDVLKIHTKITQTRYA